MTRLTSREAAVLSRIAHGLTSRAIASELGIKERTVRWHVARIFAKLGATSRAEAVALALHRGLLESDATATEHDSHV